MPEGELNRTGGGLAKRYEGGACMMFFEQAFRFGVDADEANILEASIACCIST